MIITIDGPAGTGKSTAARGLSERLGFSYLDTGAMYRAVGLACVRGRVDPADDASAAEIARSATIRQEADRTILNGLDVSADIRTAEAAVAASVIAQNPAVRQRLVELQRQIAAGGNFVCEGRDQGTVAFPHAECKFFVTAAPEVRAERRRLELLARGENLSLDELLAQQQERDRRDEQRAVAPLKPADDAVVVDTTQLTTDQVLELLEAKAREKLGLAGAAVE